MWCSFAERLTMALPIPLTTIWIKSRQDGAAIRSVSLIIRKTGLESSGKVLPGWERNGVGDPFQKDPDIDADCQPPVRNEFYSSGYDRGHIVASEDRVYCQDANGQTFYMTNMYPQMHSFNAGIWADMEKLVRNFLTYDMSTQASHANDTLYVCKGGTIDSSDQILNHTENGYIVPKYFFCAVLLKNAKGYQAIGFWFRHSAYGSSETVKGHVVNIKRLEELTGLDFFCNLPDDIERSIENASCDPNTVKEKWGF